MKTLLLIRGLPGSGKTTLAETLLKVSSIGDTSIVSADDYFLDTNGEYRFDRRFLPEAHEDCQKQVRGAMTLNYPLIVVHNTFTRDSEMSAYYELAEQHGYRIQTVIAENRHESESIHGVPDFTIEKMRERFSIKL